MSITWLGVIIWLLIGLVGAVMGYIAFRLIGVKGSWWMYILFIVLGFIGLIMGIAGIRKSLSMRKEASEILGDKIRKDFDDFMKEELK